MTDTVKLVGITRPEALFTIELTESAVRALAMIGDYGVDALEKYVATTLSPRGAADNKAGLRDVILAGGSARRALELLYDARAVVEGRKIAVERPVERSRVS